MTLRILISLSLALFAWQTAVAQWLPAEDFFNSGAQFYISNNIPAALERVETGLKTYPNDEKLKKLEKLLKQQQQQQQTQQQNQQQKQQQSKNDQQKNQQNQQNQSQQQKDQQKQDQQKQDEQKKSEQQKQEKQKKQQEQQSSADKQKAEHEKKENEGQPLKPGQMTPEEAKKLLDAQKDNEQLLQMKPEGRPQDNSKPVKDW